MGGWMHMHVPSFLSNIRGIAHTTIPFGSHTHARHRFADGEVFVRILQEIRGRDCFVIVPTNSNDKYVGLIGSVIV